MKAPFTEGSSGGILDPISRVSEVLFGLIMVLTFSGSLSVAEAGRDDVRTLKKLPEPPKRARLGKDDWLGAVGVFLLVFLSLLPVAIPFRFMQSTGPALRVSNAIAVGMLFILGYAFGRLTGRRPWLVGISMVAIGSALVSMTIALGG